MTIRKRLESLKRILGPDNFFLAEAFIEKNLRLLKIKKSSNLYVAAVEYIGNNLQTIGKFIPDSDIKKLEKEISSKNVGAIHSKLLKEFKEIFIRIEKENKTIKKSASNSKIPAGKPSLPNSSQSQQVKKEPPEVTLDANSKRVPKGSSVNITWATKNAARVKRTNIPGITSKSPLNGSVEVEDVRRRRDFYLIVESLGGETAEAKVSVLVETQDYQKKKQSGLDPDVQDIPTQRPQPQRRSLTNIVSPSTRPEPTPRRRVQSSQQSDSQFSSLDNNIILSIDKTVLNISKIFTKQLKLNQRIFDNDRRTLERNLRTKKEEGMEEGGPSGGEIMKAGAEKMLSPFKTIIDKIINFLFYTFLGRAFTEIVKWMNDPKNKGKVEALGKFLKTFWPIIAGAAILFLTPLGGFILGTIQFLMGAFKTFKTLKTLINKLIFKKGGSATKAAAKAASRKPSITTSGGKVIGKAGAILDAVKKPFKSAPKITGDVATKSDGILSKIATSGPLSKIAEKMGGKGLAKLIPGIGAAIGAVEGTGRLISGDIEGALLSYASGIPVAGWGAVALDLYRDFDPQGYKKNIRAGMSEEEISKVLSDAFGFAAGAMAGGPSTYASGGNIFSGLVKNTDGVKVSGAGSDTQAFPVMGGGMAVLQPGEVVLNKKGVENAYKIGIDPLQLNTGPNANKPVNITGKVKAMRTGGVVGGKMYSTPTKKSSSGSLSLNSSNVTNKFYDSLKRSMNFNMNKFSSIKSENYSPKVFMNNYSRSNIISPKVNQLLNIKSVKNSSQPPQMPVRMFSGIGRVNMNNFKSPITTTPKPISYSNPRDLSVRPPVRTLEQVLPTKISNSQIISIPKPPITSSKNNLETVTLPPIFQNGQSPISMGAGSGTQVPTFSATCSGMSAVSARKALCDIYGIV